MMSLLKKVLIIRVRTRCEKLPEKLWLQWLEILFNIQLEKKVPECNKKGSAELNRFETVIRL